MIVAPCAGKSAVSRALLDIAQRLAVKLRKLGAQLGIARYKAHRVRHRKNLHGFDESQDVVIAVTHEAAAGRAEHTRRTFMMPSLPRSRNRRPREWGEIRVEFAAIPIVEKIVRAVLY